MHALKTFLTITLLIASQAHAGWTLNNDESILSFISIKASDIAEVHSFTSLSGNVTDDGSATVEVDLASVATLIPVRNERMKELLFEISIYPVATITAGMDLEPIGALAPGASLVTTAELLVEMHGEAAPLTEELRVTRLDADTFVVSSQQPLIVNAGMFNLVDGIDALREVAGLPNISKAVPVSFTLIFERN